MENPQDKKPVTTTPYFRIPTLYKRQAGVRKDVIEVIFGE